MCAVCWMLENRISIKWELNVLVTDTVVSPYSEKCLQRTAMLHSTVNEICIRATGCHAVSILASLESFFVICE
jgi:hypothetical protein